MIGTQLNNNKKRMANSTQETTKQEAKKVPLPTPKPTDFEKRARLYQVEVELLQRKFSVIQRPIITPYGPDIQLGDAKELPKTEAGIITK